MAPTGITRSPTDPWSPDLPSTGDIAAAAFARFASGVPPDEVVTELGLPVDTVEYLWRTWARLRGVVPLSAEAGRALREALYCNGPIAKGADVVASVRRFVERPLKPCPRCKSAGREYCTTCPAREAMRAARGTPRASTKSTKKGQARNKPYGLPDAVEPTPVRAGVSSDAFRDADHTLTDARPPRAEHSEDAS